MMTDQGELIYCVCSVLPEEGRLIIDAAVQNGLVERVALTPADVPAQMITKDGDLCILPFFMNQAAAATVFCRPFKEKGIKMNKMTVLYPFIEDGYNEQTASFIEELSWIRRSRRIDMLITVDKPGRISALLKKAGLSYEEIPFSRPVGLKDFYFTALYKLVRSSLPLFFISETIKFTPCTALI